MPFAVFRSPWQARFLLASLPVWSWALVLLPVCLFLLGFLLVLLVLSRVWPLLDWFQIRSVIGNLLSVIFGYTALVLFFSWVITLVRQAALPKMVALAAYALQAVSLILALAVLLSILQDIDLDKSLCSKQYLSPSGQRSIVIRDQEDFSGDADVSYAYFEGTILRKDLGDFGDGYVCRKEPVTLKWSANERQVDWKASNWLGHWQF